jgi:uncharacterized membrane protein
MDWYLAVKTAHILSSTILFGTGIGIAFFMFRSHFTDDVPGKLYAARNTVLADKVFTFPAVVIQPATGAWLVWSGGFDWTATWLVVTYAIYALAGLCWLPVVWIQAELRDMLIDANATGGELPDRYAKLFRLWFLLGWPAFVGLVVVFFVMVAKPT